MKQNKHGRSGGRAPSMALPLWPSIKDLAEGRNNWERTSDRIDQQANDNPQLRQLENHYSLPEVEASWSISLTTLYRAIARGNLMAVKIEGQWRISASKLAEYLRGRAKPLRLPGHERRRA